MKPPAFETCNRTSKELDALFIEHNLSERLSMCHCETQQKYYPNDPRHPDTIEEKRQWYSDENGATVAVIFYYTHRNGSITRHIRTLTIGDKRFSPYPQPPVHPEFG